MRSVFSRFASAMVVLPLGLALAGCGVDDWLGGDTPLPPLPGKRISVLSQQGNLEPEVAAASILLTTPTPNDEWPQAGGYANHAMYHMEMGAAPHQIWSVSIGEGSAKRTRLLASPIEAMGKVFTLDAAGKASAFDATTGALVWMVDTAPDDEDDEMPGGGVAFEGGAVFATTGYGEVVAMQADTGAIVWRKSVLAPVRSAPTVRNGKVFVQSADNQLHALSAENGDVLWTHQGLPENTTFLGGTSPAVDGDVVVVAYSSGELFALRTEGGNMLWQEQLSTIRRTDAAAALTDILALPVIDRGRVYAIGNADSLVALDLNGGTRLWEREIGGLQTPWVDGDTLFLVTNSNDALAVEASTGKVLWVTPLQIWEDEAGRKGRIQWVGPLLASDRLIIAGSNGELLALSPYDGSILGLDHSPDGVRLPPILANGILYFLTVAGELVAYR